MPYQALAGVGEKHELRTLLRDLDSPLALLSSRPTTSLRGLRPAVRIQCPTNKNPKNNECTSDFHVLRVLDDFRTKNDALDWLRSYSAIKKLKLQKLEQVL